MRTLEYRALDEALTDLSRRVLEEGLEERPRGMGTTEITGCTFRLHDPRNREVHLMSRRWSPSYAIGELCWHWSGSDDLETIAYYADRWRECSDDGLRVPSSSYGKKIFGDGERSAWNRIIHALRQDPSSRRAVLVLAERSDELGLNHKDVACLTTIQFLIRQGKLHCITTARSNDLILGLPYDVYFSTMTQERLALELELELGWYQHTCASLHIYNQNKELAWAIAGEDSSSGSNPMPPMTGLDAVDDFLSAERAIRLGMADSLLHVSTLPTYWQALLQPVLRRALKRGALPDVQVTSLTQ
ncbi:MAG TPA: thymidylate synthase [Longimicrobium sp.]|nr:thymidylate synthase [Longimicrobium sp.]